MNSVAKQLKEIAKRIKRGEPPERFKKMLDKLLDTPLPEKDDELDRKWEEMHRKP